MIAPIHNHSEYSALDGYSKPQEIAQRLVEIGSPGAYLTDHGTLAGHYAFRKALNQHKLLSCYGVEAYQARWSRLLKSNPDSNKPFKKGEDEFHLVLLAVSKEGHRNLVRIVDESHRTGFYFSPRLDWELLEKYREGLVATSSCVGSLVCRRLLYDDYEPLNKMIELFGDDFYIELGTYDSEEQREMNIILASIALERGLNVIYANDAHYAYKSDYQYHEALLCAQMAKKFDPDMPQHSPSLYIMSEEETRNALSYLPESIVDAAIENSCDLLERGVLTFDKGVYLPRYPDADNGPKLLYELIEEALANKYPNLEPEVIDRVVYEYNSIIEAGLCDYFLIVYDYINYALNEGIMVGPGRGSVGGSILAYLLGITTIDPLRYGLQFERFWNPGRTEGLPDIDIDFDQDGRQKVIDYLSSKYGPDRVMRIGNHMFMGTKLAFDKAGMVLYKHPPYNEIAEIKKIISTTDDAGISKTWEEMWHMVGDKLQPYRQKLPELFDLAEHLAGRLHTYGIHASAVVVANEDLKDVLPARMASDVGKQKVLVTQAEMHEVADRGFPKFDLLGLRNLDVVMLTAILSGQFGPDSPETRRKIVQHFRNEIDYNNMPEGYWSLIDDGYVVGLFQISAHQAQDIARRVRPRDVEDLAFMIALNRPGPIRGGIVDRCIRTRNNSHIITYPHEILEPILAHTYGEFIYQEQVIDYFKAIGYSPSDADHIRKILGKKLTQEMQQEYDRYIELATQYMPQETAEQIWHMIEDFSKYSFNKAHAVGYGIMLAWTLYAKATWPVEFIMASIITDPGSVADYVTEARRMGIEVLGPDINESDIGISKVGDNKIRYGLANIKYIGTKTAQYVINSRPYSSIEEFLDIRDSNKSLCNKRHVQSMMDAGVFDSFGYRMRECSKCKASGRSCDCYKGWERYDIPTRKAQSKLQEEYLGISLIDVCGDIALEYKDIADNYDVKLCDILNYRDRYIESYVDIIAVVKSVRKTKTKNNKEMAMVKLAWDGDEISTALFPDLYVDYEPILRAYVVGEFTIRVTERGYDIRHFRRLVKDGKKDTVVTV